jgi:hypothetical protein
VPERLHERLLHDVVGFLPGAKQESGPMCSQRVPGDQRGISIEVAATGPGYRLHVVDGSPHSTQHTYLNTPPAAARFPVESGPEYRMRRGERLAAVRTYGLSVPHEI